VVETTGPGELLDLSGWTLEQTDSFREFTIPDGTMLGPDQSLLVIRGAPIGAFETFWNTDLDGAVIVEGGGEFPAINGDETYTLLDDTGAIVDGPTPALGLGEVLLRDDPVEDGTWTAAAASQDNASPGHGYTSDGDGQPYIAEVSDAYGNGSYDNEFIELRLR
jgi:hypothetical protein